MTRFWKICGALALAGCAAPEAAWEHPSLPPAQAAQIRAVCEARAEEAAGPQTTLPRPCGAEISAIARDNCQREADLAYAQIASRLRARQTSLAACLTEAGFARR